MGVAGDGTTTATILTRAIFTEGCKGVSAGMNPMDLRRGIQMAVDHITKQLEANTTPISDVDRIAEVATISANNDAEVGSLIANAMEKVTTEGVITVKDGQTLYDELEVVEGMKFDRGYISPYFITDNKSQKVELEDPMVLCFEKKVSNLASIMPLLEGAVKQNKPPLSSPKM